MNTKTPKSKMRGTFTLSEVAVLRNELAEYELDCWQAGELIEIFLRGHGYGVSIQAARAAAGRVELAGCAPEVIAKELEGLALVN